MKKEVVICSDRELCVGGNVQEIQCIRLLFRLHLHSLLQTHTS